MVARRLFIQDSSDASTIDTDQGSITFSNNEHVIAVRLNEEKKIFEWHLGVVCNHVEIKKLDVIITVSYMYRDGGRSSV